MSSPSTPPVPAAVVGIATSLDPILGPLGFAPGQVGYRRDSGQVIFCRGLVDSVDGECVDLVIDIESSSATWRIIDVRYWGFPSERWHLNFPNDATLAAQLEHLARTLPGALGSAPRRHTVLSAVVHQLDGLERLWVGIGAVAPREGGPVATCRDASTDADSGELLG